MNNTNKLGWTHEHPYNLCWPHEHQVQAVSASWTSHTICVGLMNNTYKLYQPHEHPYKIFWYALNIVTSVFLHNKYLEDTQKQNYVYRSHTNDFKKAFTSYDAIVRQAIYIKPTLKSKIQCSEKLSHYRLPEGTLSIHRNFATTFV